MGLKSKLSHYPNLAPRRPFSGSADVPTGALLAAPYCGLTRVMVPSVWT